MTLETEDLLQSILDSLDRIDYIRPDDIPDIELYMDQVTTFMDSRLKNAARNPEVDKILTKTMINNYAKNDLLPPPVRKKYSREHMLLLIFIYYFKGILSISDIQTVLKPITDRFFAGNEGLKLESEKAMPALLLICDGQVHPEAVRAAGLDEKGFYALLKRFGIDRAEDCLFMSVDSGGIVHVQQKQKNCAKVRARFTNLHEKK